ncbi:hypothetical protein HZS_4005 [Henneguya salminicola]|nr:hypothetical protein HZS_4005 [Henneguya salminicola]
MKSSLLLYNLILSVIYDLCDTNTEASTNYNISNSFRIKKQSLSIDLSKIVRSPFPLYFDVAVIVTKEAIDLIKTIQGDPETVISAVLVDVSKTFSWHNWVFSVRKFELWEDENKYHPRSKSDLAGFANYFYNNDDEFDLHIIFEDTGPHNIESISEHNSICSINSISIIYVRFLYDYQLSNSLGIEKRLEESIVRELGRSFGFKESSIRGDCQCVHLQKLICPMEKDFRFKLIKLSIYH